MNANSPSSGWMEQINYILFSLSSIQPFYNPRGVAVW